ncbi:MAG: ATP synthase F1 subunit gamma [Spirochaetaceae bacterium]|jgi:F-type H+-transporting ATPase subunit gamma|nr:ATP synthase F1 subunit gamma [Spirochaetaceae bacterium]
MANLRDVQLRMRAVRQTLQVTKAMNLIATSKLRKGRRVLEDTEPFFTRIQKSMYDLLSCVGQVDSAYFPRAGAGAGSTAPPHSAVLVITSDKGLAGGYNANVCRRAAALCETLRNPLLIIIGAVGCRHFARSPYKTLESISFKSRLPDLDDAKSITDYLTSQYLWGIFQEAHIVYTHMYSAVKTAPEARQIVPLDAGKLQEEIARSGGEKRVELRFEYEPSAKAVFDALAPFYIKGVVYGALVEAYASEQNARMAAMDEASKNAQKMLEELQLHYNRVRQASITQEVTEIVSGSAALLE